MIRESVDEFAVISFTDGLICTSQAQSGWWDSNRKAAEKIALEYEKAVRTKRTFRQVQNALDRIHEEISLISSRWATAWLLDF